MEYDGTKDELNGTYFSAKTFPESQLRELGIRESGIEKLQTGAGSKGTMNWKREGC